MKYLLCLFMLIFIGCTSNDLNYEKSNIKFDSFKEVQAMYDGEKIYTGYILSSLSLKDVSEKNAYPITKLMCTEKNFIIKGGVDLETEQLIDKNYRYSAHIQICKDGNCKIDILHEMVNAECSVELNKNFSNQTYKTNASKLYLQNSK